MTFRPTTAPTTALIAVLLATAACSSNTTELAYTSDETAPQLMAPQLAYAADVPAPRVAAVAGPVEGPAVLSSDNKPVMLRTGLNSDPNNPSGAPARSEGGIYD